jgi:hypothetical protein
MIALHMRALAFLFLVTACVSTPSPVAAPAPPPAPKKVVVAPEPEPPPEPLASENIELEQKWDFASSNLGTLRGVRLMPEDELVKRLPAALRVHYQAVAKARSKVRDAQARRYNFGYLTDKKSPQYFKQKAAAADLERARKQLYKAHDKALDELEKAFQKTPSAEVGIAIARSLERGGSASDDGPTDHAVAYGSVDVDRDAELTLEPLRRAVSAATADDVRRWARLELVHQLMATDSASEAEKVIEELMPGAPSDQRAQLLFRLGLLQGKAGANEKAADTLRSAHDDLAVSSGVSREQLFHAELIARYRAKQFERVIALAVEAWNDRKQPRALKPDPSPPPPPPPPPVVKATKKPAGKVSTAGVLGTASSYGMIGLLGSLSSSGGSFDEDDLLRYLTDSLERLGKSPESTQGPDDLRAGLHSRLAARALYRNDDEGAKTHGEAARSLDGPLSYDGRRVLRVLAFRAEDMEKARALDKELNVVGWAAGRSSSGAEDAYLDAELESAHRRGEPDADSKKTEKKVALPVERNVRAVLRLCLEPVRHEFVDPKQSGKVVAKLVLKATVFPKGKVEIGTGSETLQGASSEVAECMKKMAPAIFAHAPSSVVANVSVMSLDRQHWGSIFGRAGLDGPGLGSWGGFGGIDDTGVGGMIGIGGGGLGGGLGGIGGIGGRGTGSLGPKKKKPAPKPVPKKK